MPLSRIIRVVLAALLAFVGVAVGGATPAHAAYPTTAFSTTYGNSYTAGTLTWYNRSIGVTGNLKTTEGNCRGARFRAFVQVPNNGSDKVGNDVYRTLCSEVGWGSITVPISGTIDTNIRGAADFIQICLTGQAVGGQLGTWPILTCTSVVHP